VRPALQPTHDHAGVMGDRGLRGVSKKAMWTGELALTYLGLEQIQSLELPLHIDP
jgi:hypothetical protein